ncbi:MAG: DNA repair protein RadC [Desulfovibrionaceae bacterium]|nr:DNA repair protein RadC [Desulfovibrionaceae bacterium]
MNDISRLSAHGHRARLRKRFLASPAELPDYELLELLLGYVLLRKDTKPLSKELLKRFGSLHAVLVAPPVELRECRGFGPSLEAFWTVLKECSARCAEMPVRAKILLDKPEKVVHMARKRLSGCRHEEIWGAFLDNQNHLLCWRSLSRGTGGQVFMPMQEVLALALEFHATGIILVHNHPGGNVMPSPQDIDITLSLARAARQLSIRVLDHIIVTDEQYLSMNEKHMLHE